MILCFSFILSTNFQIGGWSTPIKVLNPLLQPSTELLVLESPSAVLDNNSIVGVGTKADDDDDEMGDRSKCLHNNPQEGVAGLRCLQKKSVFVSMSKVCDCSDWDECNCSKLAKIQIKIWVAVVLFQNIWALLNFSPDALRMVKITPRLAVFGKLSLKALIQPCSKSVKTVSGLSCTLVAVFETFFNAARNRE